MGNGFLDDLPDLDLPRRKKRNPADDKSQVVEYIRLRCPECNSTNCPVYSSRDLPVRYHKCGKCGHTFKSIELNYQPENDS